MARRYEYLFTIRGLLDAGVGAFNLWTGEQTANIGGKTYKPTNIVESVSISSGTLAGDESRVTLRLFATTDALRSAFLADPGPALITIRQVVSTTDGAPWALVPRAFTGRISGTELRGDRFMVDIVDRYGDPLRPAPLFWSDEDQQRRFPGDKGLKYMKQIAAGLQVEWP